MISKLTLVFIFFGCFVSSAQHRIRGKTIDASNGEPLVFANITFNNSDNLHVISDINGEFSFASDELISSLICTYTGYKKLVMNLKGKDSAITLSLVPAVDQLGEVIVGENENPANKIIRKVSANAKFNHPESLNSFSYDCYNKAIFDFLPNNKNDSLQISSKLKNAHLLLMESVTRRKFLKPGYTEDVITATRVSGFQNPTFASLATDLQPFSFYDDHIKLFDIHYLNPISDGSLKKYKFILEDTIYQDKDTVFVISFKPKKRQNFDALKGLLYINSNKYAIQNIIASPAQKGKIDLKIQQQYQYLENKYWFPAQLNYRLEITDFANKNIRIYADGKSYISNVSINIPLLKKDFAYESVYLEKNAAEKDSVFWNSMRNSPLTPREKKTYVVIDSIGKAQNYDRSLSIFEKALQGKFPLKNFDIDLTKTLIYNKYEGLRIGTGFFTNTDLSKSYAIDGFFGYGVKDKKWKYGGGISYFFSKHSPMSARIAFEDNLREIGSDGLTVHADVFNFREFLSYRFDRVIKNTAGFKLQPFRYVTANVSVDYQRISPQYLYEFHFAGMAYKDYRNASLSLDVRYAFGEKSIALFGNTFSSGTKYPIFYVHFTKAVKGLAGDFNFSKIEIAAEQSFYNKGFGRTTFRFEAGYIDRPIPAGLLFTGEGSYDAEFPLVIKSTFQTMRPYEFLSDRYTSLFLSHDFGTLLVKLSRFQPNISVQNNLGWGDLSEAENHLYIPFKIKDKVYCESGIKGDNLIKYNYLNIGYLGFGAAVFYRYGQYAVSGIERNLVYKFTLNFTIK